MTAPRVGIAPKLTQERQDEMLVLLRRGLGITDVAASAGVSRHTVRRYRDTWKAAGVDLGLHGQVDLREVALAAVRANAAASAPELPLGFEPPATPTATTTPEDTPPPPAPAAAGPPTASEWDQPPPPPAGPALLEVTADGGPAGGAAPLVVALEMQLPVSLIALYNLLRQDGLNQSLNDFFVEAIELHFRDCWGIGIGVVRAAELVAAAAFEKGPAA